MSGAINSPDAERLGPLASLRRRVYLTYRYLGWRTLLFRIVTFPLRFTPLRRRLQLRSRAGQDAYRRALAWYREHGRPVPCGSRDSLPVSCAAYATSSPRCSQGPPRALRRLRA